jgi:hypothetical protein
LRSLRVRRCVHRSDGVGGEKVVEDTDTCLCLQVMVLTADNFNSVVGGDKPVLVEFYAPVRARWAG